MTDPGDRTLHGGTFSGAAMTRHIALALFLLLSGCASTRPGSTKTEPAPLPYGVDLSFLHPVDAPGTPLVQASAQVPAPVKDHVFVYFVNGFDPLYVGNFKGLCQYVKTLGFRHAYCGEMSQTRLFREHMRKVHAHDPAAQFVLVGYSAGANSVRDLAHELKQDGIPVALLAYVGGDTIRNVSYSRPENAERVLNLTSHGLKLLGGDLFFKGSDLDGATNRRLDTRHMLLPSRKETAELLGQQLLVLCQPIQPEIAPKGRSMLAQDTALGVRSPEGAQHASPGHRPGFPRPALIQP
jgi:hypothetical protein